MMRWKVALIVVVLVIAGAAGAIAWNHYGAIVVEVDMAGEGAVQRLVGTTGYFTADEERKVVSVHGMTLSEVHVEEGDEVEEDQVLVRGDASDLQVQREELISERTILREEIATAERNLPPQLRSAGRTAELAEENLHEAEHDAETLRELYEAGAAPKNEYRKAELAVSSAESELERARAAVAELEGEKDLLQTRRRRVAVLTARIEDLERKISEHEIRSPRDMSVAEVPVEEGEVISPGTPVVLLHGADMKVEVDLIAADAREVTPGARAVMTGEALGGEEATGSVTRVHPHAVEKVSELGVRQRRVPIEIRPDEIPAGVRPGYPTDVDVVVDEAAGVVMDRDAVFQLEGVDHAFIIRDERAHLTEISLRLEGDDQVVVASGVGKGESVVVNPPAELTDGARVRAVGR